MRDPARELVERARALAPLLAQHAAGDDALLAEHARWALDQLG